MFECQNRINELNECVQNHVDDARIWLKSCELRASSEFGCGVFATRDIEANELLFGDKPLMLGPTGNKNDPVVCVMCYDKIEKNFNTHLCPGQCGLILCGKIACAEQHNSECDLLQTWKPKNPNELSFVKAKAMAVIRSLFLNAQQQQFFDLMQKNYTKFNCELQFDGEFGSFPDDEDIVRKLRDASVAINTNAYKVLYTSDGLADVNVRGFYPIMSLINHMCLPNARHDIDRKFVSRVSASRPIKKDEQIFVSYSQLLWCTNTRRMHMLMTKQFQCKCQRCADPTENATHLSAIRCMDKSCAGLVLPIAPINFKSDAKCNACGKLCENKRLLQTQQMSASMSNNFLNSNFTLAELKHFIEARLLKLVPECNQFVAEAKLAAIWKSTTATVDDFNTMKRFCEDILTILNELGAGECSLKGHLALKLYTVRKELRNMTDAQSNAGITNHVSEFDAYLNDDEQLRTTARLILTNVSAAPMNFEQ